MVGYHHLIQPYHPQKCQAANLYRSPSGFLRSFLCYRGADLVTIECLLSQTEWLEGEALSQYCQLVIVRLDAA